MNRNKIKAISLLIGGALMLLGLASCNKEPSSIAENDDMLVVPHAVVRAELRTGGDATKANFAGTILSWTIGDRLVMVSNGQVNGTLVCTGRSDEGGVFEGEVAQFTPDAVNLYFLGNRDVQTTTSNLNLSQQSGSASGLVKNIILKKTGLKLIKDEGEGEHYITDSFDFTPVTSVLNMDFTYGIDMLNATTTVKAKSAALKGLKNIMSIDLLTGNVIETAFSEDHTTTITAARTADYAASFYVAVVPQTVEETLSMKVEYNNNQSQIWSNIDWETISDGGMYKTEWSSDKVTIASMSSKAGYNGQSVEGGENADGKDHKNGYNGQNADGTVDDPTGNKNGYNGQEVIQ